MTALPAGSASNRRAISPPADGAGWPPFGPQLLREYTSAQDYHRQALHLARSGWHPVNVTATGVPFALRALNVLSLGLFSLFARVEPSLLVTYSTTPRLPESTRDPVPANHPPARAPGARTVRAFRR